MNDTLSSDIDNFNLSDLFKSSSGNAELLNAIEKFYDEIETKTDIDDKYIIEIIKVIYYGEETKQFEIDDSLPKVSDIIKNTILLNYYRLRISRKREGRKEAFQFFTGTKTQEEDKGFFKGLLSR